MPIPIRSPDEIAAAGRAGALAWRIVSEAVESARAGATTGELDALIEGRIRSGGAEPVMKGACRADGRLFPAGSSICVNEEVVHAVPGDRILRAGDVVTIDLALRLDGWCVDVARGLVVAMPTMSESSSESWARSAHVVRSALRCLDAGLGEMASGRRWSEVARAVADEAVSAGVVLVGDYAGHGIGRELHEPPDAWLGTGQDGGGGQDFVLRPGMLLTLEPIIMEGRAQGAGRPELIELDDGWTVLAGDRRRACHEERTVAITRGGPVVLTGPG